MKSVNTRKLETGQLVIVNLRDGGERINLRFPETVTSDDVVNYEAMDVAGGLKPLSYANREPQETTLENLLLDGTLTNQSVEPEIENLRRLLQSNDTTGAPPELQLLTEGWALRCVLTKLSVKRDLFTNAGTCIRAFLTLTLLETRGVTSPIGGRRRSGNSLSGRT